MKNKNPLISVILPTYNRAHLLPRAINSVLNQTYKNIELIIVDDASTDNTQEIVKKFKKKDSWIKYVKHKKNKGGSAARNTGIKKASGDYIALLDDDDEWVSLKIEKQLAELKNRSREWGGAYCWYKIITNNKKITIAKKSKREGDLTKDLLISRPGVVGSSSSLFFRKNVFSQVGYFDEKFQRHQDTEFLIRFLKKFKLAVTKEILLNVYGHNYPSPEKMVKIKKQFFQKFEKDIKQFPQKDIKFIYALHNLEIAHLYAKEKKTKNFFKYLKKSLKNRLLPPVHYIKLFLYLVI